jgi:hypothetical protein
MITSAIRQFLDPDKKEQEVSRIKSLVKKESRVTTKKIKKLNGIIKSKVNKDNVDKNSISYAIAVAIGVIKNGKYP